MLLVSAFFENVARHSMENRDLRSGEAEENVVLEFRPEPAQHMLAACLWSDWGGPDLLSFAAITDEHPGRGRSSGS